MQKPTSGRGSAADPSGGAYSTHPDTLAGEDGAGWPIPKYLNPCSRPFGPQASALHALPLSQNRRLGPSQHGKLNPPMLFNSTLAKTVNT